MKLNTDFRPHSGSFVRNLDDGVVGRDTIS
jgi:hypothetical protein